MAIALVNSLAFGSYIGDASGTLPAHQTGDLILMFARRESSTAASLPAGWTDIGTSTFGSTLSLRAGYKIAASSSETSGTWTNGQGLFCRVYRLNGELFVTPTSSSSSGTSSVTCPDLTVAAPNVAYVRGVASSSGIGSAPAGWANSDNGSTFRSFDALNVSGSASAVGGNTVTGSAAQLAALTVGFGVKSASSGAFFQFF